MAVVVVVVGGINFGVTSPSNHATRPIGYFALSDLSTVCLLIGHGSGTSGHSARWSGSVQGKSQT